MRLDDTLDGLNAPEPNADQAVLLRDGMEVLGGVLSGLLHQSSCECWIAKRDLWTLDCHNLRHGVAAGDVSEISE